MSANGVADEVVDVSLLSLRDELLTHQQFASSTADGLQYLTAFVPGMPFAGAVAPRSTESDEWNSAPKRFLSLAESLVRKMRGWPDFTYLVTLPLTAGAKQSGGVVFPHSTYGSNAQAVRSALHQIECWLVVLEAHSEAEGVGRVQLAEEWLRECDAGYEGSRLSHFLPSGDLGLVPTAICQEFVAAIAWSSQHMEPHHSKAPKEPRLSKPNASSSTGKESVLAFLRSHHADDNNTPLKATEIARSSEASTATVTRALQSAFGDGGHQAYVAACDSKVVSTKLAIADGEGRAFGTADPVELDQ